MSKKELNVKSIIYEDDCGFTSFKNQKRTTQNIQQQLKQQIYEINK